MFCQKRMKLFACVSLFLFCFAIIGVPRIAEAGDNCSECDKLTRKEKISNIIKNGAVTLGVIVTIVIMCIESCSNNNVEAGKEYDCSGCDSTSEVHSMSTCDEDGCSIEYQSCQSHECDSGSCDSGSCDSGSCDSTSSSNTPNTRDLWDYNSGGSINFAFS